MSKREEMIMMLDELWQQTHGLGGIATKFIDTMIDAVLEEAEKRSESPLKFKSRAENFTERRSSLKRGRRAEDKN
jgi:hypothetical protein